MLSFCPSKTGGQCVRLSSTVCQCASPLIAARQATIECDRKIAWQGTGFFASQTSIKQRFGLPSVGKERLRSLRPVDKTRASALWPRRAPPCFWPTQAISCVGIYFGIYFRSLLRNCSVACALTLCSGVHHQLPTFLAELCFAPHASEHKFATSRIDGAGRAARGARAPLRPGPGPRAILPERRRVYWVNGRQQRA